MIHDNHVSQITNNSRELFMSKTIQHFLFGFGAILDIFKPAEELKLSRGGFAEDNRQLNGDAKKIANDFSKVINGNRKNTINRQK